MDHTIGDIAQRSGLTIRALHHYEKLGLLPPPRRTEGGYRLYGEAEIAVLHRILAYQEMGLRLKDIGPLLGAGAPPLLALLTRQIAVAQEELSRQQARLDMLKRVARRARKGGRQSSDELLALMATRRQIEQHFGKDEVQKMLDVQQALGDAGVARLKTASSALIPALQAEMANGAAPTSPQVKALARRWISASRGLPDDETMRRKGRAMLVAHPHLLDGTGFTLQLLDFIDAAVAAAKTSRGSRA